MKADKLFKILSTTGEVYTKYKSNYDILIKYLETNRIKYESESNGENYIIRLK